VIALHYSAPHTLWDCAVELASALTVATGYIQSWLMSQSPHRLRNDLNMCRVGRYTIPYPYRKMLHGGHQRKANVQNGIETLPKLSTGLVWRMNVTDDRREHIPERNVVTFR